MECNKIGWNRARINGQFMCHAQSIAADIIDECIYSMSMSMRTRNKNLQYESERSKRERAYFEIVGAAAMRTVLRDVGFIVDAGGRHWKEGVANWDV